MKTKGIFLCITMMMLSLGLMSCYGEKWSDATVTKSYYKGDVINGLDIECPATVVVSKSQSVGGLVVELNSNLADDLIVTKDAEGIVKVTLKRTINVPSTGKLIINISANVNSLAKLDVGCASSISFNDSELFQERTCEIDIEGASQVTGLNMNVTNELSLSLSGASDFRGTIAARDYDCELSGASNATMNIQACNKIDIELSGASDFNINNSLEEASNKIKTSISGASELSIPNCMFIDGDIEISGASHAKLWVTGILNCDISGASVLELKGDPSMGNINITGASEITNY